MTVSSLQVGPTSLLTALAHVRQEVGPHGRNELNPELTGAYKVIYKII